MNSHARQLQDRRLKRVPDRNCARPGCSTPAVATLLMRYGDQEAVLTDLTVENNPELYDLCATHGDRTRPPRGWTLEDERSDDVVVVTRDAPRSVHDTVALLAAALHPAPEPEGLALVSDDPIEPEIESTVDDTGIELLEGEVEDRLFGADEPAADPSSTPPLFEVEAAEPEPEPESGRRGWRVPAAGRDAPRGITNRDQ